MASTERAEQRGQNRRAKSLEPCAEKSLPSRLVGERNSGGTSRSKNRRSCTKESLDSAAALHSLACVEFNIFIFFLFLRTFFIKQLN